MPPECSRRSFLQSATAAVLAAPMLPRASAQPTKAGTAPVVIASGNGLAAVKKAGALLQAGSDPLDAVVAGVNIVEADPTDTSVGYGGLPNEAGVVQLDASVMHGPTHQAGAVAALEGIMHPSSVARLVMRRSDHVMLVGDGAARFARAHGFKQINLLTDRARQAWLEWKETLSDQDDWIAPNGGDPAARGHDPFTRDYGTINCCAVTTDGDLAGVTTTSGLAYKIPGRIGDSPIIGAGLYVDNAVGAAGATGRGEAVILSSGSAGVIEFMRQGQGPEQACLSLLQRIADQTRIPRLRDEQGRPNFQVVLYAVAKDGRFGSAALWERSRPRSFAVYTNGEARLETCAYLYKS